MPSSDYSGYELMDVSFPFEYVAHVQFNRPKKLNAMKEPMWTNLKLIFEQLSHDSDVRAIVLSAAGEKAFSAGLDVQAAEQDGVSSASMKRGDGARTAVNIRHHILQYQEAVTPIEKCEKPVIVVLHGIAFGAAIDISTACDIRICAEKTQFCVKETDLGLAADVGTLTRLPKMGVSLSWVKDICYTARVWGPEEALKQGFVSEVLPDKSKAIERGLEIAQLIASKSPVATMSTKQLIDWSRDRRTEDGLLYTGIWNASMLQSADLADSMKASLEKRTVRFPKL